MHKQIIEMVKSCANMFDLLLAQYCEYNIVQASIFAHINSRAPKFDDGVIVYA